MSGGRGDSNVNVPEWDPRSPQVLADQISAYDALRRRCPIAHSQSQHWSLFRHEHVLRALLEPDNFSNEVSAHLSVPNGMDPPVHTGYRRAIDPYFSPERMRAIEPRCRQIASTLLDALSLDREIEIMGTLAEPYALQSQAAFLDWPAEFHQPLREWMQQNHAATRSGDPQATAAVALAFDKHIRAILDDRRQRAAELDDVASRLLREQVQGRNLTDEEIVSILRNWTVGELGTIAASVGILVYFLADHRAALSALAGSPAQLERAIDEILRIHPPLIASRRKTAKALDIGGVHLPAGERLTLLWASANRDESVFGDPDEFRMDRDPEANLLYGKGIHDCPGAPLARLELRVLLEEILRRGWQPRIACPPVKAVYPASGFATLQVRLEK